MSEPDFPIESIPNPLHGPPCAPHALPREQNPWLAPILPFAISLAGGILCLRAAGPTLGLFLSGLLLVAFITGPLIVAEKTWLGRALCVFGIIHGVAIVWLYAALKIELDPSLLAACYLTLASFVLALAGLTAFLHPLGVGAGAMTTLLATAWLTWPIWLSPALHGARGEHLVAWLLPANPIFAANGMLRLQEGMGIWNERSLAYNLTTLQDEVLYSLPTSVLPCVLLHVGIAVSCVLPAFWNTTRKRRSPS